MASLIPSVLSPEEPIFPIADGVGARSAKQCTTMP